jgi:hypothetical protein
MTEEIAKSLHLVLKNDSAYLGMHAIDFSYPIHLALYRNSMIPKYRIQGKVCYLFYSMGEEEDERDHGEFDEIKALGFEQISWEDTGARQTIFDNYDTLEHFSQVEQVKNFIGSIAPYLPERDDEAEELAMLLEDLDPKLFNSLGAATRAFSRAQNEEDLAHVGLSGRRYMEQLADVLFPANEKLYNDRKVTKDKYKNRLWAFIDSSLPTSESNRDEKLAALGKEVDRLIEEFNLAIHGNPDKDRIGYAYGDLAKLTARLLSLSPENVRKPYYAYEKTLIDFLLQVISTDQT